MDSKENNLKFPMKTSVETQKLGEKAGRINIKVSVEITTETKEILPGTKQEKICIVNTIKDLSEDIIKMLSN